MGDLIEGNFGSSTNREPDLPVTIPPNLRITSPAHEPGLYSLSSEQQIELAVTRVLAAEKSHDAWAAHEVSDQEHSTTMAAMARVTALLHVDERMAVSRIVSERKQDPSWHS
jgi:hypothetical protein